MTWFKVDDGLHSHPKWIAARPAARALWVTAGSWCASHLTDGHVPEHALSLLGGRKSDAAELVRLGLWQPNGDGWQFHDWSVFQPLAESVEAERAAARERQRRARNKARESRRDARRDSPATDTDSHGPPDPTRPDPTRPSTSRGAETHGPRAAGPPPHRCAAHLTLEGPVPPCRDCADARRHYDAWRDSKADETGTDRQQAAARERERRARRVAAGSACPQCNDSGWRLDDNGNATPCDCDQA